LEGREARPRGAGAVALAHLREVQPRRHLAVALRVLPVERHRLDRGRTRLLVVGAGWGVGGQDDAGAKDRKDDEPHGVLQAEGAVVQGRYTRTGISYRPRPAVPAPVTIPLSCPPARPRRGWPVPDRGSRPVDSAA